MIWLSAFAGYNVFVLCLYGFDKLCAKAGANRVRERLLIILSALGGAPGALCGMVLFHHKISKPSFRYPIPLLYMLQMALWTYLIWNHIL